MASWPHAPFLPTYSREEKMVKRTSPGVLVPPCRSFGSVRGRRSGFAVALRGDNSHPYEVVDDKGQAAGVSVETTRTVADVRSMKLESSLGARNEMRREHSA